MIILRSGREMPEFIHEPNYASDVRCNVLSIDRIISESDWRPEINIEAGIEAVLKNWNADMSAIAL